VAASAPGYVWVSLGERASRTETAHCLPASPYGNGYVFYAAIARASSGSLDWSNVHAVILTGSTYFELLIRGPDKLIVGARAPAADSWSVVSQSREHIDPTLQYSVEVSDSPEPGESRLTLKAANAVARQDRMLARRAMLDEPLICPTSPVKAQLGADHPIDPEHIPIFPWGFFG